LGQLFCDGSAKQIVAMLVEECAKGKVTLRYGTPAARSNTATGGFIWPEQRAQLGDCHRRAFDPQARRQQHRL
jgi:predicted flavoprotein YhiN